MNHRIDSLLAQFPRPTLSPERDRQIRAAILSAPAPIAPAPLWRPRTVPRFALAFIAILIAVTSVSGFAYASSDVTRGDVLYPVKRSIERVEGGWQRTPIARVRFHSKLALRRLEELEVLLGRRASADRVSFIPVAHAAGFGALHGDRSDPISWTAREVAVEASAAVAVVGEIEDPAVVKEVTTVLIERQGRLEDGLMRAARAAGVVRVYRTEAIAQAIEGVREASTTTRVVAAEAAAEARGARDVRRVTPPKPGDPTVQSTDVVVLRQQIIDERAHVLALGDDLDAGEGERTDAARLLRRVEQNITAADDALTAGDAARARRSLETAAALRKNAKHFVKSVGREEDRRHAIEDGLAEARQDLADAEEQLDALRDALSTPEILVGASELIAVAHERLADAARAFVAGEYDRARTQIETVGLLIDRVAWEMNGVRERVDRVEEPGDEPPAPEDARDGDEDADDRVKPLNEDDEEAASGVEREEAQKAKQLESRRGRVKGQQASWDAMGAGSTIVNPETGVRIEFEEEYLRPLAW